MDCILAIDPGSVKCGVAVVRRDGKALFHGIVSLERLVAEVQELIVAHGPQALIIGAGTGSKPLVLALQQADLTIPIHTVDESHTSEAARLRFVAANAARGWQRLLPRSLRTPDRAYDDYVALILAERWWLSAP
jgi:RNase H-fold protein (predicted Holliday junction resolvase)